MAIFLYKWNKDHVPGVFYSFLVDFLFPSHSSSSRPCTVRFCSRKEALHSWSISSLYVPTRELASVGLYSSGCIWPGWSSSQTISSRDCSFPLEKLLGPGLFVTLPLCHEDGRGGSVSSLLVSACLFTEFFLSLLSSHLACVVVHSRSGDPTEGRSAALSGDLATPLFPYPTVPRFHFL